jgi:nicotinamide-nucleotide amidase
MSFEGDPLIAAAAELLSAARERGLTLVTAESCTGGLIAAFLTEVPGASDVLERGFVTYSNAAKTGMLGVPAELIERYGAVSEKVARAMASGALDHSCASVSLAVTGVAGPGGGTAAKPVGLVYLAASSRRGGTLHREIRTGDIGRGAIRRHATAEAFVLLKALFEV